MENKTKLSVTLSPYFRQGDSVKSIMYAVILALVPALIASYIFFGIRALNVIIFCVLTAVVSEAAAQFFRKKPVTVSDGSVIITGILLAFNLPPNIPVWIAVIGTLVSVLIAKQVFGGLGQNIFNPALVGRAFLLAAYPSYMTSWTASRFAQLTDVSTYATPLAVVKENTGAILPGYMDMFLGNIGGCIGETSALAILAGGIFLLARGVITWHVPVTYLTSVALITGVLGKDPIFHLLAGGLMLGAFFMATDMVTCPVTPKGRVIFGIGCGILTCIIRLYGSYPEGVSYSILLMNGCTPLIDKYTAPKKFGSKSR